MNLFLIFSVLMSGLWLEWNPGHALYLSEPVKKPVLHTRHTFADRQRYCRCFSSPLPFSQLFILYYLLPFLCLSTILDLGFINRLWVGRTHRQLQDYWHSLREQCSCITGPLVYFLPLFQCAALTQYVRLLRSAEIKGQNQPMAPASLLQALKNKVMTSNNLAAEP